MKKIAALPLDVLVETLVTIRTVVGEDTSTRPRSKEAIVEEILRHARRLRLGVSIKDDRLQFKPQKKGRGRRGRGATSYRRYREGDRITVLRRERKKVRTDRDPYKVYRTGMTVEEVLKNKEVTRRDLNWDSRLDRPGGPVIRVEAAA